MFILDGLIDSPLKKLIIWLDIWSKGPRGPGQLGRALRPAVVRTQKRVGGALRALEPQGRGQTSRARKKRFVPWGAWKVSAGVELWRESGQQPGQPLPP